MVYSTTKYRLFGGGMYLLTRKKYKNAPINLRVGVFHI